MRTASHITAGKIPAEHKITQRMVFVCVIVLAHVSVIALFMRDGIPLRRAQPEFAPITAELLSSDNGAIPTHSLSFDLPQPAIDISPPELPSGAFPDQEVESPRIDESVRLDTAPYAARAQLEPGSVAAILLLLEIAPDGSVISASVVRSNSGDVANAAAIDYARTTRWMPGMIDGVPRAMQASLTVILGESG